jgi:hypothetical protein
MKPEKKSRGLRLSLRGWMVRLARVTAATLLLMVVFSLAAFRVGFARATEVGMAFGNELLNGGSRNLSGMVDDDVYHVTLNGQRFDTSNALTKRSLSDVLDYFQAQCKTSSVGLEERFNDLAPSIRDLTPPTPGLEGIATVREQHDNRGFVFCIAPDHELTPKEKVRGLYEIQKSSEFSKLGDVRYIAAQEDPDGTTQLVAVWTHGKFNLYAMFPPDVDCPGEDFQIAPRPEKSRRTFAGYVDGTPFGANVYTSEGPPDVVMKDVDAKLNTAGWKESKLNEDVWKGTTINEEAGARLGRFYAYGNNFDLVVTITSNAKSKDDESPAITSSVSYVLSKSIPMVGR